MIAIAENLDVDLHEVLRRSPVADVAGAEETLRECMFRSIEVRYGLVDGEIACVWGLIPPTLLSTTAYLWLLTTDIIAEHKFLFIRHSQRYIEQALEIFPNIIGDCIVGNQSAKRWLTWLGAEFSEPVSGRWPFVIRAKVLHG
jgi:hypothetical protein